MKLRTGLFLLLTFFSSSSFAQWVQTDTACYWDIEPDASCTPNSDYKVSQETDRGRSSYWVYDTGEYKGRALIWAFYPDELNQYGACPAGVTTCNSFAEPSPTCDSPNYIDVVSGECVSPAEICYTDLESMADECVLLREDDPDGVNCVTDASGLELCLDDNPLCYQANGKTVCPDADSVCGEKNGSFQCVAPQEEGCGMFNGEKVCFDPSGNYVDAGSPDHPDNGGNLDGDNSNDVTDSRDPVDGGDPENQPNQPIDTPQTGLASEITARKSLLEQKKISASLKDIQDNGLKTDLSGEISESEKNAIIQNGASGSWDDPATGTWASVDEHIGGIGDVDGNSLGDGLADGIGSIAMGLVDQGSCSDLGYQVEGFAFSLGCDKTQKIRDFLSWALYLLTVWALFEIVVTPATRKS